MHNFRKTIRTTLLFLLAFVLLSVAAVAPFFCGENDNYQDYKEREELAGSLDYLILGASHAKRAFNPYILDQRLDVSSYDLSSQRMPMSARYDILEKELDRNPVKTVVLECSFDTLRINKDSEEIEGDLYYLGRLGNLSDQIHYFCRTFEWKDYKKAYEFYLDKGFWCWKRLVKGTYHATLDPEANYKGYSLYKEDPIIELPTNYAADYKTIRPSLQADEEGWEWLQKMVDLCHDRNAEVILVATPVTRYQICRTVGYDQVMSRYTEFAEQNGLAFYDFSLLKTRDRLFHDSRDFYDFYHLYNEAADTFTNVFCDVVERAAAGEDVLDLFYASYAEYEQTQDYYPQKEN